MVNIKYNKSTSNLFIFTKNKFFKVPLSLPALKSIINEINNYKIVGKDQFFNKFLPEIKSFKYFFSLKKKSNISYNDERIFFRKFINSISYKNEKKKKLIDIDHYESIIQFVKKHNNRNISQLNLFLEINKIYISSSHGDFYKNNIVKEKKNYFLIDWPLYSKESNIIFDLINFKIFSSKYYKNNWYEFIKKNKKHFLKFLEIKYLKIFVLWKISNEIKSMNMNNYKVNKYKIIIDDFFEEFISE
tara:strand:- start:30323 stop:31057 length:735 start_codon:yes stop_codon:yes gene_type:complete